MTLKLTLRKLPETYAVARLPAGDSLPDWLQGDGLSAMVRAQDELTMVCPESRVPQNVQAERGWACLRTIGPFPFDAAGIVHKLIGPLSENGIGVFVLCTFDGEHLLYPQADAARAEQLLRDAGHQLA